MLKDRIILLEGVDCSGKSRLAKIIAERFDLDYIDTEHGKEVFGGVKWGSAEWALVVAGINFQQAQFFRSTSGFVKTRYSLTEEVYSQYYRRKSFYTAQQMERGVESKVILMWVDLPYDKYKEFTKSRPEEEVFSKEEFDSQRNKFAYAFDRSRFQNKAIVENHGEFDTLTKEVLEYLAIKN